ncbi:MAG: hypothetical protein L6Q81_14490 [Bacteroidia bacterium]|nr:hypothetical protein [Bacteroidia bacterium]
MKSISAFILFVFITASSFAQSTAPKFETAVEYNDYIVDQQTAVGAAITAYMNEVDDSLSTKESCNKQRLLSLAKVKDYRNNIKAMPAWKGDASLRDTALLLFDFYVRTFENSYAQVLDLIFTDPFTEETELALDKLVAELTADEAVYDSWFLSCQERFALKYGFTLTE